MPREATKNLIENISKEMEEGASPGGALIVRCLGDNFKESTKFQWGFFAEHSSPRVNFKTIYDIASITKLYTTALIIELLDRKQLSLNTVCAEFLLNFGDSQLTLFDLLTHRAKFGLKLSEVRAQYGEDFPSFIFDEVKPPKSPTEGVFYENINFIYLGRVIEIILNKPLASCFTSFFERNGLQNTYLGTSNQKDFYSPPTEKGEGMIVQNITHDESARLFGGIAGNAGIFASVEDLVRFGSLWLELTLSSGKDLKNLVFKNYSKDPLLGQGLGWWCRIPGREGITEGVFSHSGYTGCLLAVHPKSSVVVGFTCNRTWFGRGNTKHYKIWELIVDYLQTYNE